MTVVALVCCASCDAVVAADAAVGDRSGAASLARTLAKAREAAGGAAWRRNAALVADGAVEVAGLHGRWSRREDLRDGRWSVTTDVGVFRSAEGFDGRTRWRQDPSGGVHALNGAFATIASATDAWLARRGWLRPDGDGASFAARPARSDGGRSFAVVEATPRGGQPVELWFDMTSHLLDRTVRTMPISTLTVRYGDYRRVGGRMLPFTIESRESGSSDVEAVHVERWTIPASIDRAAFAAPMPPNDATLDGETTVPLEIDGLVTVDATLNGQTFAFILDTGGHDIITPEVAKSLGVQPVGAGATGGSGPGELAQQYVRIDRLEIGSAALRDQHFYVIPFQYGTIERGARPPLAGLLGLEIFERFAVRIDYPAKRLTLRAFDSVREPRKGRAVAITFDDDMPLLDGRIDGIEGLFALDTGNSGTTVVQPVWARKHGLAERLKRGIETVSYGAGGASPNWASRAHSLELAGARLQRPVVRYAEDSAGAFSSRTEAANIGTDVLSNFVLDFDYRASTLWLDYQPGYVPPPFNRSGMRTVKEDAATFRVALVAAGSPAAVAGIARDDRIVAVDGTPASRMSGRDLANKLVQPVGTEITLALRRNDDERIVTLKLAELLP